VHAPLAAGFQLVPAIPPPPFTAPCTLHPPHHAPTVKLPSREAAVKGRGQGGSGLILPNAPRTPPSSVPCRPWDHFSLFFGLFGRSRLEGAVPSSLLASTDLRGGVCCYLLIPLMHPHTRATDWLLAAVHSGPLILGTRKLSCSQSHSQADVQNVRYGLVCSVCALWSNREMDRVSAYDKLRSLAFGFKPQM